MPPIRIARIRIDNESLVKKIVDLPSSGEFQPIQFQHLLGSNSSMSRFFLCGSGVLWRVTAKSIRNVRWTLSASTLPPRRRRVGVLFVCIRTMKTICASVWHLQRKNEISRNSYSVIRRNLILNVLSKCFQVTVPLVWKSFM